MKLNFKKTGEGEPLIILHGLLGSLDNWQTLARKYAEEGFTVYSLDARNHGQSPHTEEHTYPAMAADLKTFSKDHGIESFHLLGHSMGGKTAMHFAVTYPDRVKKLIVADIAPKNYPLHHEDVFKAILAVDLDKITSRSEAEEMISEHLKDDGVIQFILKSLYWVEPERLAWRFNIRSIVAQYEHIAINTIEGEYPGPALFIRGGKSKYIEDQDMAMIRNHFPEAKLATIEGAGHWLHAEAPADFMDLSLNFLKGHQK